MLNAESVDIFFDVFVGTLEHFLCWDIVANNKDENMKKVQKLCGRRQEILSHLRFAPFDVNIWKWPLHKLHLGPFDLRWEFLSYHRHICCKQKRSIQDGKQKGFSMDKEFACGKRSRRAYNNSLYPSVWFLWCIVNATCVNHGLSEGSASTHTFQHSPFIC